MKLIFSRKGFDASSGGIASPIFDDGHMVSLPIPSSKNSDTFADLNHLKVNNDLITELSGNKFNLNSSIHLDPDLDRSPHTRPNGWLPALGQVGAARTHLTRHGISAGDVFIFFGWFRAVSRVNGVWSYVPSAPNIHVMFGWLEVGHVFDLSTEKDKCLSQFPGLFNHPHIVGSSLYTRGGNTIFIGTDKSRYLEKETYGGGRFNLYSESLQLTKNGCSRSVWSLPDWFNPKADRRPLSHHEDSRRWELDGDRVTLKTVGRGQEFVIDSNDYPELDEWVGSIIGAGVL